MLQTLRCSLLGSESTEALANYSNYMYLHNMIYNNFMYIIWENKLQFFSFKAD